jgi:hypothetical protein
MQSTALCGCVCLFNAELKRLTGIFKNPATDSISRTSVRLWIWHAGHGLSKEQSIISEMKDALWLRRK